MLTVVTWKWSTPGYRSTFTAQAVNVIASMVRRHYLDPHRVLCVTNEPEGIDSDVVIVPDDEDFADVPSPHGGRNPSCYRRLRMFKPDIASVFGPRFVSLDLDVVLVGDMRPVWNRPEAIVLYGETNPQPGSHYNGSMILMTAGCRPQVWNQFDPATSPQRSIAARAFGSDQGHISCVLGPGEATFRKADGVYSFRNDLRRYGGRLPSDARVVICHGEHDPWRSQMQALPWVREHYRLSEVAA